MSHMSTIPVTDAAPDVVNFRYGADDEWETLIGPLTPTQRFGANLAAIRTLKQLERDSGVATAEDRRILSRYCGWGDMQVVNLGFNDRGKGGPRSELAELLTQDETRSLLASTLNAHYTRLGIARAIWSGVATLYDGTSNHSLRVLDPSAGTGVFEATAPAVMDGADWHLVEIDALTARMLPHLQPGARVYPKAFERVDLPRNAFDLAISNIPFGHYPMHDPSIEDKRLKAAIHIYFLARAITLVKPGGVVAFITSRYTLDAADDHVRRWIADRADLLAAARLPSTAFSANAGTEVVTDVLVLRKRECEDGARPKGHRNWLETVEMPLHRSISRQFGTHVLHVNQLFAEDRELVIGELNANGTMNRKGAPEVSVSVPWKTDIAAELRRVLERQLDPFRGACARKTPKPHRKSEAITPIPRERSHERSHEDEFSDGANGLAVQRASSGDQSRWRGLQQVYAAAKTVLAAELRGLTDVEVDEARRRLNETYDEFRWRFGRLNDKRNTGLLKGHPALPFLLALELETDAAPSLFTDGGSEDEKAPIFFRRTVRATSDGRVAANADEALVMSFNRFGRLDLAWMAEALGVAEAQVARDLSGRIFYDPDQEAWVTDDAYLSGNVVKKLHAARAAAAFDPSFAPNVAALEAVQPPPVAPDKITAQLGAAWIPVDDIHAFIEHILPDLEFKLRYTPQLGAWHIEPLNKWHVEHSMDATAKWGTPRLNAFELLDRLLNSKDIVVYDPHPEDPNKTVRNVPETLAAEAKGKEIQEAFTTWLWVDAERAHRVAEVYNATLNCYRSRRYDGAHLTLPGLALDFEPWPSQQDAVWRCLQSRFTLIGHKVGLGKTAVGGIAGYEAIRLGLARKVVFSVPKHLRGQWGRALRRLYPHASVTVAGDGDLSTSGGKRQTFLARIATADTGLWVITHDQFEVIPTRPETMEGFIRRQVSQLEDAIKQAEADADAPTGTLKDLERSKKRYEVKLRELEAIKRDSVHANTWEELGVDMLVVDECHVYKNLEFVTRRKRIKGLPNAHALRSLDFLLKRDTLAESGGRLIGLTGTPLSNTIAEAFTLMRYFCPDILAEAGLEHFDPWCSTFAEAVTGVEVSPDGRTTRLTTRLSRWHNLPELAVMIRQVLDVPLHDPPVQKPHLYQDKPTPVVLPLGRHLARLMKGFVERADRLASGMGTDEDSMLRVCTDARHASIDPRLIEPGVEDATYKINALVANAFMIWRASERRRGAQMIFCDVGVPKPKDASASTLDAEALEKQLDEGAATLNNRIYALIKQRLVKAGIPAGEIAFIHEAKTDAQRLKLFDAMNAGRVRITIGSTDKMGTGTNAQRRLIALHNLDVPWRPDQLEQRIGRIARPGNEYPTVFVFNYITEKTFDAFSWQTQENKARFIGPFMAGEVTARTADDIGEFALSAAAFKAFASGNPTMQRRIHVEARLNQLAMLRHAWLDNRVALERSMRSLPGKIEETCRAIALYREAVVVRESHAAQPFTISLRRDPSDSPRLRFSDKEVAGAHLRALDGALRARANKVTWWISERHEVGSYMGFDVALRVKADTLADSQIVLELKGDAVISDARITDTPAGTIQSVDYHLRALDAKLADRADWLTRLEKELADTQGQLGRAWEHTAEWDALEAELAQIDADLNAEQTTKGTGDVAADGTATDSLLPAPELPEAQEADEPPSAEVLASQALVRQALEEILRMHNEMPALTDEGDENEASGGEMSESVAPIVSMGRDSKVMSDDWLLDLDMQPVAPLLEQPTSNGKHNKPSEHRKPTPEAMGQGALW